MEKRYQAFVSSTYLDLLPERAEVMQALLELNCMPAGMELFPAANEDQWNWIKRVIDESDYYIVIVGGRYGSVSGATHQSYTEMEYRYAIQQAKPVIGFLHFDPGLLPAKDCDKTPETIARLQSFRELVGSKLCKLYSSPSDLGAKVSRSLTQLMKQHPAVGWIRADTLSEIAEREILALRRKVDDLEKAMARARVEPPSGSESLAQGNQQFSVGFSCERKSPKKGANGATYWVKGGEEIARIEVSWDELFEHIGPSLIEKQSQNQLAFELDRLIEGRSSAALRRAFPEDRFEQFRILSDSLKTILIQFRALGLIQAKDPASWVLTPFGDTYMTTLMAVKAKTKRQHQPKFARKPEK